MKPSYFQPLVIVVITVISISCITTQPLQDDTLSLITKREETALATGKIHSLLGTQATAHVIRTKKYSATCYPINRKGLTHLTVGEEVAKRYREEKFFM